LKPPTLEATAALIVNNSQAADMDQRAISKILVNSAGALFVVPESKDDTRCEYIYREANGLRWDKSLQAFHAYEPGRWQHDELLRHIATTVRSAFDEDLRVTEATVWEGIAPELEARLRMALQ
jgi:hypothetical protein